MYSSLGCSSPPPPLGVDSLGDLAAADSQHGHLRQGVEVVLAFNPSPATERVIFMKCQPLSLSLSLERLLTRLRR
jgi:hypothetical protein